MSGKQTAVLWMGIILVALNLNWAALKAVIFTGGSSSKSGGGFKLPSNPVPFVPGPAGIPIPVL